MGKKHLKRALAIFLVGLNAVSLTGCSSVLGGAENYPLVPALTSSELRDYYAEALKYDSVVSRTTEVHETSYELYDVTGEKADQLTELVTRAQEILGHSEYEPDEESLKVVSEDNFHYIKSFLNDKKLDNGTVKAIQGALGYYFVDVDYDLSSRTIGDYTDLANLVGVHGAFYKDVFDVDQVDDAYLTQVETRLNDYYVENKIFKQVSYDPSTMTFTVNNVESLTEGDSSGGDEYVEETVPEGETGAPQTGPADVDVDASIDEEGNVTIDGSIDGTGITGSSEDTIEDTTSTETDETGDVEGTGETTPSDEITDEIADEISNFTSDGSATSSSNARRQQSLPANIINAIAGSSVRQGAYMPELSMVFNIPSNEGAIGGIGMYSTGTDGLTIFGFDKSQLGGTVTLRYVFKEAVDGSGDIVGYNIYPQYYELTSGMTVSNSDSVIPEYLQSEFEQILERYDRAVVNGDITSLVSGTIYADMGVGMLRGYEQNHVNLLKNMSTIRRIISRDIDNNAYLLEIETTRQEGPKDVDVYGTYKDRSYVVIEQVDGEFYITDQMLTNRAVSREPEINPDSSAAKRVAALNLTGEVSETTKASVENLLGSLYQASTYRILRGPQEVNGVTVARGMYDCFNSNPEMLSSENLEYYNSSLRNALTKYGSNVGAQLTGTITQWIGGTDNQVELTTEEVITYNGRDTGTYYQKYYLVSNMEDSWVIDEMTVLESSELSGGDLQTAVQRITQNQVPAPTATTSQTQTTNEQEDTSASGETTQPDETTQADETTTTQTQIND